MLNHVKSQEEMDLSASELNKAFEHKFPVNAKTAFFKTRFGSFCFLAKNYFGINYF
jgi:hypothetical protein